MYTCGDSRITERLREVAWRSVYARWPGGGAQTSRITEMLSIEVSRLATLYRRIRLALNVHIALYRT